jgi:hypothetical protein
MTNARDLWDIVQHMPETERRALLWMDPDIDRARNTNVATAQAKGVPALRVMVTLGAKHLVRAIGVGGWARITDLGLEVRDILREQQRAAEAAREDEEASDEKLEG